MIKDLLRSKEFSKIKLVISDLHLGSGQFTQKGERNPLENFFFDREFEEFLEFFSTKSYDSVFPVELILNGDILDFMSVVYRDISFSVISEKISLYKIKSIIEGHPVFFDALKNFICKENKTIIYQIGNHDPDFFFPSVQEYFKQVVGGDKFKDKITFIKDTYYEVEGNIEIHHGHQFETMHAFDFSAPFFEDKKKRKLLKLPWGSLFNMNVSNKFKKEREYIDTIYPHKLFILYSLLTDPLITLQFILYTVWYFIRTRLIYLFKYNKKFSILSFPKRLKEELSVLEDGEAAGKDILKRKPEVFAVVMGHTHKPREVIYPNGRMYINTGTWTKTVNLDLRYFGRSLRSPFCLIGYPKKKDNQLNPIPKLFLLEWKGHSGVYRNFIP